MKISFVISDKGEVLYESIAEHFIDSKDASIIVRDIMDSMLGVMYHSCRECDNWIPKSEELCDQCYRFIPDDFDYSDEQKENAMLEEEMPF